MASSLENISVLIKVEQSEENLVLYIDNDPLAKDSHSEKPVTVLKLNQCKSLPEVFGKLSAGVNRPFEFNSYTNDSKDLIVEIYIDYTSDYLEVICASLVNNRVNYTNDDLRNKNARLSLLYQNVSEELEHLQVAHRTLINSIKSEISKEIDRGNKKKEFFAKSNSSKLEVIEAKEEAFKAILNLIQNTSAKAG